MSHNLKKQTSLFSNIHTIVFDFDGIFTDNFVYTNSHGEEIVRTSRSDSFALSNFRKFTCDKNLKIDLLILSTETNKVVRARAKKLGIKCYGGKSDKAQFLAQYLRKKKLPTDRGLIFLGNDLNDLGCFKLAEYTFAPKDAHAHIYAMATHPLKSKGGEGFIREALELIEESFQREG